MQRFESNYSRIETIGEMVIGGIGLAGLNRTIVGLK